MAFGFSVEDRRKHNIQILIGQYVPPELVDEMSRNLTKINLDGEIREMTVLFTDVRNFTTISENMEPKELTQFINSFLTPLTRVLHHNRGTIDKYMGDCAMIIFGAPLEDAQHQFNAVSCAILIQRLIKRLNIEREKQGKITNEFRIGINSGEMLAGNMGSHDRMQYTVVGEAVNLAARLHTAAEQGQIVITDTLVKSADVKWRIIAHRHKSIELRGIAEPVTTYIVTDIKTPYADEMDKHIETILAKKFVA